MGMKPIHIYVAFVSAAAVLAIVSQDWPQFLSLPPRVLAGVGFLTLLGLVSEGTALRSTLSRGTSTSSITFLPLLACVLLFGTTASVLFFAVNGTEPVPISWTRGRLNHAALRVSSSRAWAGVR